MEVNRGAHCRCEQCKQLAHNNSLIVFSYLLSSPPNALTHYCLLSVYYSEFAGSATQLVADVDCTADGKSLCETVGVRGYPSIKWGDPSDLQDYQGGRDFDALKNFADENLKPIYV